MLELSSLEVSDPEEYDLFGLCSTFDKIRECDDSKYDLQGINLSETTFSPALWDLVRMTGAATNFSSSMLFILFCLKLIGSMGESQSYMFSIL